MRFTLQSIQAVEQLINSFDKQFILTIELVAAAGLAPQTSISASTRNLIQAQHTGIPKVLASGLLVIPQPLLVDNTTIDKSPIEEPKRPADILKVSRATSPM